MVVVAVTAFASLVPAPSPRLTLATSRRSRSTSFAAEAGRSWEECPSRGDPTRLTRLFLQPKAFGVDLRRTLGARLKTLAVAAASRNELRGKRTTGTPGVLGSRGLLCRRTDFGRVRRLLSTEEINETGAQHASEVGVAVDHQQLLRFGSRQPA